MGSIGGAGSMVGGGARGGVGSGKGTAALADSNPGTVVALDPTVRLDDYGGQSSFHGPIETAQAFGTTDLVSQMLSQPGQNRILVIDGGGARPDGASAFDGAMAASASRNGWGGVIVNGYVRDAAALRRTNLGVKALGTSPVKAAGGMAGQRGLAVGIGATQFQPGWWAYADADGVLMSQVDISGGSFGGGGGGGATMGGAAGSTMLSGGYGGAAGSTMGGGSALTRGYGVGGGGGGYTAGGMTGGTTTGGLTGGYAPRTTMGSLSGGYGTSAMGVAAGGGGGLLGGYGSAAGGAAGGYGAGGGMSSMSGGYGKGSSPYGGGYGGGGGGGYGGGYGGYGSSSKKKRNKKIFKMMLATSIAAVVWLVCLQ